MSEVALAAACRRSIDRAGHGATVYLSYPADIGDRHSIKLAMTRGPKGRVIGYDADTGTIAAFHAADVLAYLDDSARA